MADMKYWAVKVLHDWLTKKPYYPFVNAEGSVYFGSDGTRMSIKAALDAIKTRLKNIEVGETEVDDKTIEYNALRQLQVKKGSLTGEYMGDASIGKEKLTDFKVQMVDGTPVLFYGDDQYKLEKFRSVVSTVFSDLQITGYAYNVDASATAGGTCSPTLAYKVKKTITYSDGDVVESWLISGGTVSYAKKSGDSDVTVSASSGVVKFVNANTSTTAKRTAVATVTVKYMNGTEALTVTKDATASQKVATVQDYVYMGFLPTSISGFTQKTEALLSSITANMIDMAIVSGDMSKKTVLPIANTTVTGTENYFYIMACPVDQTNQYNMKFYDELLGQYLTMAETFNDSLRATDGGVTRVLSDGKTYKLFTFYCAGPLEYKLSVNKI